MSKDELKQQLDFAEDQYKQNKHEILKKYAMENNPYKVGDKIRDADGEGAILRIGYSLYNYGALPCCLYTIENRTKSGSISKREPTRSIYQSRVISQPE